MKSDTLAFSSAGKECWEVLVKLWSYNKTLEREIPHLFDVSAMAEISSAFIIPDARRKSSRAWFWHTLLKWMEGLLAYAVIGTCALGNVSSRAISGFTETEFPTSGLGSTFFLTILKSCWALWVLLASCPFFWALFLNALLRINIYRN